MISNKAILVNLKISQWTGRKLDRRASGQVEQTFSTERQVGNYTKKLLPGAKELDAIKAIAGEARKYFYENTLPWAADGSRMLSSKAIFKFSAEMRKRKETFENAVSEFLSKYIYLRQDASQKLGELFNEREYPEMFQLKQCFDFDFSFFPIPDVADFRVEILDSEKEKFLEKMKEVETAALRECYSRLKEVVSKAASKLKDPKAIFRDSLIENISEICQLMPSLNINEDPELEKMRTEVESIVSKISPEVVRENSNERENAAKKLKELDSKMAALMGGPTLPTEKGK